MEETMFPIDIRGLIEKLPEDIKYENIENFIIMTVSTIDNHIVIPKTELRRTLKLKQEKIDFIIDYLVKEDIIHIENIDNKIFLSLTYSGKKRFRILIKELNIEHTDKKLEKIGIIPQFQKIEPPPSFIGCLIADKNGKTLLTFEIFEGALESYLKRHLVGTEGKGTGNYLDIELIPMFISALEKFSQEINIRNLTGVKIKGTNLKMQTFSYDKYTVTFFINPHVNIKSIEKKIKYYFKIIFEKYKKDLEISIKTGFVDNISHINNLGREILKELNKFVYLVEFKRIIFNLDSFEMVYARTLNNKLKKLEDNFNEKFIIILEKVKKLKTRMFHVMANHDLDELREVISKAQDIESILSKI